MTTHKLHYLTPHIETVELKPEGMLCNSIPNANFNFLNTGNLEGIRYPYNSDSNVDEIWQ